MKNLYVIYFKRVFDIFLSLSFLIILSPIFILIVIIQIFFYGNHVFYLQLRAGYLGKKFRIIKFRTMYDKFDSSNDLLPDSQRINYWGKILRSTSLDELPNLLNVVYGHMSLIGPRPIPLHYLQFMNKEQLRRQEVKPGITGYAQVNGRNNITWANKFKLDLIYIQNINFTLDLKIFMKTIFKIFSTKQNLDLGENSFDNYRPNFKD